MPEASLGRSKRPAHLLADGGRRRALETAASLPPPAPTKVPKERYAEVARLCQRHTQADVAAIFGVSQMTIWRIVRQATKQKETMATGLIGA